MGKPHQAKSKPAEQLKHETILRLAKLCQVDFDYQLEAIFATDRKVIWNKARGVGLSRAMCFRKLLAVLAHAGEELIISRSENQAKHLMTYMQAHWYTIQTALGSKLTTRVVNMGLTFIRFSNGGVAHAISSNPEAARGYHGNVFLDEFAFFKRGMDRQLMTALSGVISGGGDLYIASTPRGEAGEFHKIWTDAESAYQKFEIPWTRRPDTIYRETVEADRKEMYPLEFAQEYECAFTTDASQPLPPDLIRTCLEPYPVNDYELVAGADRMAGGDFAKMVDASVFIGGEWERPDVVRVKLLYEYERMDYSDQILELERHDREFQPAEWYVDKTGPGIPIIETLEKKMGSKMVGMTFTNQLKERLFIGIKQRLMDQRIRIPSEAETLIEQLGGLEKIVTADGLVRYRHPYGRRDDHVWALGLMLYGFAQHEAGEDVAAGSTGKPSTFKAVQTDSQEVLRAARVPGEVVLPGRQPVDPPLDDSIFVRPERP